MRPLWRKSVRFLCCLLVFKTSPWYESRLCALALAHCLEQKKQKGKPGRTILCQKTFQRNLILDNSKPSFVLHIIIKRLLMKFVHLKS